MPPDIAAATLATPSRPDRFIKKAVVLDRLGGINAATLHRLIKAGHVPEPVRLHPTSRITMWLESQIDAVVAAAVTGPGRRPDAAIAENARRRKNRKAAKAAPFMGPTPMGRVRRAP
jgi:predicted DNA-binding transcriptional regulator AlpA